jgi:hypothetical protein
VYLSRVVVAAQLTKPKANTPIVLLPAAEPQYDAAVAAPPALTTSLEYVYLFRVVLGAQLTKPNAKMPVVLFPVAEPKRDAPVAAPPALTAQPE